MSPSATAPSSPESLERALVAARYLPTAEQALTLWLALALGRPILVEGPAGVGKTDLARAAAEALGRKLLRLQCYEGLDEARALYEWDHGKQMLAMQLVGRHLVAGQSATQTQSPADALASAGGAGGFYSERFLLERPLLAAVRSAEPVVLLIDEVDRADPELEALLLELLAEMQVTIPELGTFRAKAPPLVLLTTNGTRDMTEALRRRCLHLFVDYPPASHELAIVRLALPHIEERLAGHVVAFVAALRSLELRKSPAVSETIDWARAVMLLGRSALDERLVEDTLGLLLKHHDDKAIATRELPRMLERTRPA